MYRYYILIGGRAHFSKKLTLEKAIEGMQVTEANGWVAGIVSADLSLADAQDSFKEVVPPTCGWEG